MHTFLAILLCFISAWGCSYTARHRGYNPTIWFVAGLIFGLIALIIISLLPPRRSKPVKTSQQNPVPATPLLVILQPEHVGKLWYFLDEGRVQFGPMSFDALSQAWKEGKVREQTFVWNDAMDNWKRFQEIIRPPT